MLHIRFWSYHRKAHLVYNRQLDSLKAQHDSYYGLVQGCHDNSRRRHQQRLRTSWNIARCRLASTWDEADLTSFCDVFLFSYTSFDGRKGRWWVFDHVYLSNRFGESRDDDEQALVVRNTSCVQQAHPPARHGCPRCHGRPPHRRGQGSGPQPDCSHVITACNSTWTTFDRGSWVTLNVVMLSNV